MRKHCLRNEQEASTRGSASVQRTTGLRLRQHQTTTETKQTSLSAATVYELTQGRQTKQNAKIIFSIGFSGFLLGDCLLGGRLLHGRLLGGCLVYGIKNARFAARPFLKLFLNNLQ